MELLLSILETIGDFIRLYAVFFIGYALIVNILAFVMYALDKKYARMHRWRIPEATLILIALLGGSIGAFLAMQILRHKTKHIQFVVTVPLAMLLQIALVAACLYV